MDDVVGVEVGNCQSNNYHGKYPLEHSRLEAVVSALAFSSNSYQVVPSATLVVWTQDLWSCQGTAQCLGVECSQEMHTLVEISA